MYNVSQHTYSVCAIILQYLNDTSHVFDLRNSGVAFRGTYWQKWNYNISKYIYFSVLSPGK